jgi:hypothetical protein
MNRGTLLWEHLGHLTEKTERVASFEIPLSECERFKDIIAISIWCFRCGVLGHICCECQTVYPEVINRLDHAGVSYVCILVPNNRRSTTSSPFDSGPFCTLGRASDNDFDC